MALNIPESISHDMLLAALELKSFCPMDAALVRDPAPEIYRLQLRNSLLSLARRVHLAAAAHELTGIPESELSSKSTVELLVLLDEKRARINPGEAWRVRYWS